MVDKYGDFLLEKFEEFKKSNQELTTRVTQLETENGLTNSKFKALEKKCVLYKRERDCYRNFIKSYESEINGEKYFDLAKDTFNKLDNNLSSYRDLTETLTGKLSNVEYNLVKSNNKCVWLKEDNDKLKLSLEAAAKKEKDLCTQLDQMKKKCSDLEEQLKTWKSDQKFRPSQPEDYRIIHLKENPADKRIAHIWEQYRFLKEENAKLTTRLEIIEAGHNADITRLVNEDINTQQEIEYLKSSLEASEKKRNMLMDEFKRRSKEFREAVNRLTGYRIELTSANTYKVSFLYSDNPADYLLFKAENREVELLETDFSKNLTNFIKLYLEKYDSYPAFLAALALDIFKRNNAVINYGM